ncbi:MAG: LPP20 family lipoprotein [Nitrospirota bacterium]
MNLRLSLKLMNVFMLSVFLLISFFGDNASAQNEAQKRLMAKRAAKVDALRNLTEIIYGLQIDSHTTVRDFVTQSDLIRSRVSAVIQGAEEIDYRELPDGTAEVTMEITLREVEDILGRDIQYDSRTVQATGYGAPSGEAFKPSQPGYSSYSIRASGSGLEPNDPNMSEAEKALMAKRAAKLDALRNLAEQVYGVKITSDSYVRDFVLQSDDTRSRVNTFIQGARVVSEQQMPDGSYQVEVELDIEPLRDILGIR